MKSVHEIQELLTLSGKPGNVPDDLMAFFLYLKEKRRVEKGGDDFKAFAINSNELDSFGDLIHCMVENCTKNARFEIAISRWDGSAQLRHWSFLEFNFNGENQPPSLDILICDPLGFKQSLVLTNLLCFGIEFGYLSKLCTLKVYIPIDTLQEKGRLCAYFVMDCIAMLSNQDKFSPIYDYMRSHQQTEKQQEAIRDLKSYSEAVAMCYSEDELADMYHFDIVVGPLHIRFLRTMQSIETLEKAASDSEEIVNSKGDTAKASIAKYSIFTTTHSDQSEYRNMRVNVKMGKLGNTMGEVSSSISSEDDIQLFNEAVRDHRLSGLEQFIDAITKKEDLTHLSLNTQAS